MAKGNHSVFLQELGKLFDFVSVYNTLHHDGATLKEVSRGLGWSHSKAHSYAKFLDRDCVLVSTYSGIEGKYWTSHYYFKNVHEENRPKKENKRGPKGRPA